VYWALRYGNKTEIYDDMFEANKRLLQEQADAIIYTHNNISYEVDLKTGKFYVNGKHISHGARLPYDALFRFISFRRVRHTYSTFGQHIGTYYEVFIGWQTTVKGRNIQRMMKIYPNGNFEIVKKR